MLHFHHYSNTKSDTRTDPEIPQSWSRFVFIENNPILAQFKGPPILKAQMGGTKMLRSSPGFVLCSEIHKTYLCKAPLQNKYNSNLHQLISSSDNAEVTNKPLYIEDPTVHKIWL